jgi:hypothetical protein
MLRMMDSGQNFDSLIVFFGMMGMRAPQANAVERLFERYKFKELKKPVLAVVADRSPGSGENENAGWNMMREFCRKLTGAGILFYPTIERAAGAAGKLTSYYRKRL